MCKKLYPTDTLERAQSMLTAWYMIDPPLSFGPLTSEALAAEKDLFHALEESIMNLMSELTDIRNQRDTVCLGLWDKVKGTRAGIKAAYGDDSSEYKIAGGTRLTERKSPRRKVSSDPKNEGFSLG